MVIGHNMNTM